MICHSLGLRTRGCAHAVLLGIPASACSARWMLRRARAAPPQAGSALSCSLRLEKLQCHLFWEGESLLHIGWADTVKVARVHAAASAASGEGGRSLDIIASFQMDCLIAVHTASARALFHHGNMPPSSACMLQTVWPLGRMVLTGCFRH